MKTIVLMRHAKAEKHCESDRDFDRPLSPDGVAMATRTAVALNHSGIRLDRIICSSAARTAQTAEIVASLAASGGECVALDELYLAESRDIAACIREHARPDDTAVLFVGHNPGVADLMSHWSGDAMDVPPATAVAYSANIDDWSLLGKKKSPELQVRRIIRRGEVVL